MANQMIDLDPTLILTVGVALLVIPTISFIVGRLPHDLVGFSISAVLLFVDQAEKFIEKMLGDKTFASELQNIKPTLLISIVIAIISVGISYVHMKQRDEKTNGVRIRSELSMTDYFRGRSL